MEGVGTSRRIGRGATFLLRNVHAVTYKNSRRNSSYTPTCELFCFCVYMFFKYLGVCFTIKLWILLLEVSPFRNESFNVAMVWASCVLCVPSENYVPARGQFYKQAVVWGRRPRLPSMIRPVLRIAVPSTSICLALESLRQNAARGLIYLDRPSIVCSENKGQ